MSFRSFVFHLVLLINLFNFINDRRKKKAKFLKSDYISHKTNIYYDCEEM